ncbi:hypothetical protein HMPREF7215_1097 [Pyramidobacter piscolens W5455]|uniref:Uncharacterized protein n=1 Tax=Pyramidobacter piscolens W5455 TaxID=352165 RepID=A0ABP2HRJ9_9BACT|nr:hypothetical protein HMPREF7215_1097 [Pyramidobacter piscolens W5455]
MRHRSNAKEHRSNGKILCLVTRSRLGSEIHSLNKRSSS